ncbi:amino acid/amide ABC transporter membrane protein 2, HAAT family / amino acid/amide ABC transporter ATP-binding protein 1, HAAT family (plasmid) [Deinococcus geothermalis DSM 11300]|uniref:Amino acid/amide ABC transporter membrane protein 2, HAAT family / amino acid/amide ABC transporter ATP-binding protein 1, HAAT family n=1 Tax=Deinococcus geothermalis (strain DSM 11300 / CIP 105573 / AG-3a) TaxID=319795 RepID=Q1J3S5_DEIGD|nr:branched-chain amino acid ABC transporter ATP-binding protein/permease [Deinococcus geothermalis]ABF43859.1 amino acid/amide ABC transporter membrane protein 2, HAAT family / amino acid/amide ABC transporter ATP-binding protein 1, HAAT family [Deinococcus geothermalis DSM 11300]
MTRSGSPAPARLAFPARTLLMGLAGAVTLLLPLILPLFQVTLLVNIAIFAIVAIGLVLLTGILGLTSFGQAAFMGLGAYTTAVLTTQAGWSPWLTLPAGLVVTGLIAWVLGLLTLRMQGHYLPLATIAWGMSLYYIFGNTPALGGFTGITDIPPVRLFGWSLTSPRTFAYLALLALGLVALGAQFLLSSRVGRAMRALRSGPVVAEAFGVNAFRLRVQVFVLAALLAALAGWLYAHSQRFVNPTPFSLQAGIEYLFMAVVGGSQYVWGAVLGSALITLLREWLQDLLPALIGAQGNFEVIVFGVLIILTLQFARRGLWPLLERALPQPGARLLPQRARLPERALPQPGTPLLQVEHAVKQFGGLRAVNDVSFELRAGEILGLIGPNGAGKSTMFNLITGVAPATSGRVSFAGRDITRLGAAQIHRLGVARTFQHVHLFPDLSLLANTMLGGYARGKAGMAASLLHLERGEEAALQHEALRQLERVGLQEQAFTLAGNLALGQQRILEVARALASDPTLLLLDEPAAGLRYGEKMELAALLRRLRDEGVTILIVEHDMDLVMNLVDRLVVMNSGERLAEGTPAEIRANPAVREAYLGVDLTEDLAGGAA